MLRSVERPRTPLPLLLFCWLVAGCRCATARSAEAPPIDPSSVRKVKLVHSNHYDAGFADFASSILNRYLRGGPGTLGPPHPRNQTVIYPSFLLKAASTAKALRKENGTVSFRYMTQSYIASQFVDCYTDGDVRAYPHPEGEAAVACPNATELREFEDAVRRGDVFWHAFPHNAQVELMNADFFTFGINSSIELAARFGRPAPRVLSQRDVPGLSRAAVPLLRARGVVGVSVGVNDGSPPPLVPSVMACYSGLRQIRVPFLWRDEASGTDVIADYHPGGYGGVLPRIPGQDVSYYSRDGDLCDCVGIPGFDEVLCYAWKGDNYGPAGVNETKANVARFAKLFPNAETIEAGTLGDFFAAVDEDPRLRSRLPVVHSEIGDSWFYGTLSDPYKVAAMRAMMRRRKEFAARARGGDGFDDFSRFLLKLPEHTWGSCGSDHMHITKPMTDWTADDLAAALAAKSRDPFFTVVMKTWDEQRAFIGKALDVIKQSSSASVQSLAEALQQDLADIRAPAPTEASLHASGYAPVPASALNLTVVLLGDRFEVAFDSSTGGVVRLQDRASNVNWASAEHPAFRFMYRAHSYAGAVKYAQTYKYDHGGPFPYREPSGWPWPGMNSTRTVADEYHGRIVSMHTRSSSGNMSMPAPGAILEATSVVVQLQLPAAPALLGYGPPRDIWLNLTANPDVSSDLLVEIVWDGKRPTRLRESMWLEVRPELSSIKNPSILLDKMGSVVDAADVVPGGGAALHGIDPDQGGLTFSAVEESPEEGASFRVTSLDAGSVAPGFNTNTWDFRVYDSTPPRARDGAAFGLFSNLYATNYPMWYPWREEDGHSRFRFELEIR